MRTQWEYKVIQVIGERSPDQTMAKYERTLNAAGQEGWEVFAVEGDTFYLKRPKS